MAKSKKSYTKAEKRSWWNGVRYGRKSARKKKTRNMPKNGAYNARGRVNDGLVDDRHGPVVFWDGEDL